MLYVLGSGGIACAIQPVPPGVGALLLTSCAIPNPPTPRNPPSERNANEPVRRARLARTWFGR
jgi:hypothetical protein